MSAYVVVDTRITDPERYEQYKALAGPLVERFGGRYLARGGDMVVVDDDCWTPTRIVLLEFADVAAATRFLESDEYAPASAMRHEYADSTVVIVDGLAPGAEV